MPSLGSEHPVKLWIMSQKTQTKPTGEDQEKIDLLTSVVNSQFNLITDLKMKASVIELIAENTTGTNLEKLINSYLYLLIGNTTRSDNILKEMIRQTPREFYQGFGSSKSLFHKTAKENLDKILNKFTRHPADRLTFHLFSAYLKYFFNQTDLMEYIDEIDFSDMKAKMELAYTAKIAPDLVGFLRLANMNEKRRMEALRSDKFSFEMQSLWVWNFLEIDPLISESMIDTIRSLDKNDPLWTVYLLSNEKISDMYFKKGGQPVSRRRQFLRGHLENQKDFMLTLYKLLEIGDIDQQLVQKVSQFMIHE
jgi:hypothetical protein